MLSKPIALFVLRLVSLDLKKHSSITSKANITPDSRWSLQTAEVMADVTVRNLLTSVKPIVEK
jgi:hypothetical protein